MKIIRPINITDTGTFTRSTTATYTNSSGVLSTAAIDSPRFNYNPANLIAGPSLLIEPASTNLLVRSEEFNNAAHSTPLNLTLATNATTSPDGVVGAESVLETVTNGLHAQDLAVISFTSGTTYSFSMYFKSVGGRNVAMYLPATLFTGRFAVFDLTAGTVISTASGVTATITTALNGWWRCTITEICVSTASSRPSYFSYNSGISFAGDVSKGLYIFGGQVEVGSVSSYIPTVASAVLRAADVNTAVMLNNIPENDYAAYNAATRYVKGDRVLDVATHKVYEAANGARGVVQLMIGSPGVCTMWDGNSQPYLPALGTELRLTTTGSLPTGISVGVSYYVVDIVGGSFRLATIIGGSDINFTGSQSGVHTATVTDNIAKPVTSVSYWLDAGSSNKWKMFDQVISSQSVLAGTILTAITPGGRFDSIVGLNCSGTTATINIVDPVAGNVYSQLIWLISDSGITNWYSYFYEPIVELSEFIKTDILVSYPAATITVAVNSSGSASVGGLVVGLSREIGYSEWGAKVGTIDYSVKTRDAFGNYVITPRNFSKRLDLTIQVPTNEVDSLQTLMASYRTIPVVYVGSNVGAAQQFNSTIVYGFYKDFSVDLAYNAFSVCSLQIEGLT